MFEKKNKDNLRIDTFCPWYNNALLYRKKVYIILSKKRIYHGSPYLLTEKFFIVIVIINKINRNVQTICCYIPLPPPPLFNKFAISARESGTFFAISLAESNTPDKPSPEEASGLRLPSALSLVLALGLGLVLGLLLVLSLVLALSLGLVLTLWLVLAL